MNNHIKKTNLLKINTSVKDTKETNSIIIAAENAELDRALFDELVKRLDPEYLLELMEKEEECSKESK